MAAENGETLSQLFDSALESFNKLDSLSIPSNGDEYQNEVKKMILKCEDATRLVSRLDIFSRNEDIKEVPNEHIKLFLLPVLLGHLNAKVIEEGGGPQQRLEVIKICEIYYKDFLQRCKDYQIAEVRIPDTGNDDDDETEVSTSGPPSRPDLAKMNREREEKIKRYKEMKELEANLKTLSLAVKQPSSDEDTLREYHLTLIKKFIYGAIDELNSFAMEKPVLKHMSKVKSGQIPDPRKTTAGASKVMKRPFKPIVITRDKVQKEVFGMGYKGLPILSIEEFYEQRVRDGWFPDPNAPKPPSNSLMDRAAEGYDAKAQEEEEERVKEEKEEQDDREELERKRRMDEYKDTHRRGEGNRHNMG